MYLNAELYISRRSILLEKFPGVGKILEAARQQPRSLFVRVGPMPSWFVVSLKSSGCQRGHGIKCL